MPDPKDEGVGIEIAWSLQGFSVKIRSRLMSALDHLGATKIAQWSLDGERKLAINRALTDTQLALIDASTKSLEEELRNNPDLAKRTLTALSRAERQSENIEVCLGLAIEDLKDHPSTSDQPADAPEALNPEFLNRWEQYASGATSEVVREKWARVLSSEIRAPGKFSSKILRIVDELDQNTAVLFQRFCECRMFSWAPAILLDFKDHELRELQEAELIIKPDLPAYYTFATMMRKSGGR
ncbi:DUF2806 domain-containing protein [Rhizobium leguminosarum]|uniref:DUF2806 domain-containing protein n=1 Tax=Rhizobium leguminosarum TaxID=384 RepID=UPI001C97FB62|nr:DUF2806 domain-containing protein [Rhizobium leguminosarum]MBY5395853.1 DUF2806 domain-containing protein [Rhizobium leguminosarum]